MWKNPNDGRFYLIGVVARGSDCPNWSRSPGVYTKVQPYVGFMRHIESAEKLEF